MTILTFIDCAVSMHPFMMPSMPLSQGRATSVDRSGRYQKVRIDSRLGSTIHDTHGSTIEA